MFQWVFKSSLYVLGHQITEASVQFASIGESIGMICPYKNVYSWQKLDTQDILASCENGMNEINSSISYRISVSNDCEKLKINEFTAKDVGLYRCYVFGERTSNRHKYDFNITIRTLKIVEAYNSSVIKRKEGENITLTCVMEGQQPDTILFWTTADVLLASNRSRYVIHCFRAQRMDDMKQFVCTANSSNGSHLLEVKVQLRLLFRPRVSVVSLPSPPTITKGGTIRLLCEDNRENNENINSFSWSHDGQLLPNNTNLLLFENADPVVAGEYTCLARNIAGEDFDVLEIIVTFPPVVQNETVVFETNSLPRTLQCKVLGVPDNYTFSKWLHYTYSNQQIRILDGLGNGTLILPNNDREKHMYEDTGIYICNVTNNIPDEGGYIWQTGKIKVIVAGRPVLANPQKHINIGYLNETSRISIYTLSSTRYPIATWLDKDGYVLKTESCTSSEIETEYYGNLVNVSAYKCDFYIKKTQEKDFQKYAVKVRNDLGESLFEISLIPARKPEIPRSVQVIALKFKIIVKWHAGNSYGFLQAFCIEYRKSFDLKWSLVAAESNTSVTIDGLQIDTVYFVRVFSRTMAGESNKTGEVIVKTGNHHLVIHSYSWEIGVITSAAGVVFLICVYGMKALTKRICLDISPHRHNLSQDNGITPVTHEPQYDEIDSVHYNPSNVNDRPEALLNNIPFETLLSSNNDRNMASIATSNDGTTYYTNHINLCGSDPNITIADNVSMGSSSDDSYLVPCRKYINIEIGVADRHNEQMGEQ
ncbi:HMCN [Mytilus coruscus]|uniref:HMCN n=1 Tax=Mytilus coruscus TaxID=42192 RepID=A0A6J8ETY8_MYTCO|nr:HMCN [Mytilus coruscus]